jgi:hypothetical protein
MVPPLDGRLGLINPGLTLPYFWPYFVVLFALKFRPYNYRPYIMVGTFGQSVPEMVVDLGLCRKPHPGVFVHRNRGWFSSNYW